MIAKLIKTGEDKYHIESKEFDGAHLACYPHDITKQKLSLKNCQAIEKGYDLDELIDEVLPTLDDDESSEYEIEANLNKRYGFIKGFKKALEILGDKKHTKEDMLNAYEQGINNGIDIFEFGELNSLGNTEKYSKQLEFDFENSLERKEWDVFIVIACGKPNGCDADNCEDCQIEPSLDENGCLQLTQLKFQK